MKKQVSFRYLAALDLLLAAGMSIYWLSAGETAADALQVFLAILTAGLPIPLWLSSPLALARGTAKAKKQDILLRSSAVLSEASHLDTLAVSKNGVVTEGAPYVAALIPEGTSQSSLLCMAASAEYESRHPLGQAIRQSAVERSLPVQPPAACNEFPGCGVEALVARSSIRVGKPAWLQEEDVHISADLLTKADQISLRGQTTVFVANSKYCRGIIVLDDTIPQDNLAAFRKLQRQGLRLILLTGDSKRTANAIRRQAGLDDARPNLSPQDRVREIQLLQARGATVAMIGQGASSRLAMAEADLCIQIRMTENTSESQPPADIILQSGKLWDLAVLLDISRKAMRVVRQNRIVAVITWLVLLPPALGLFHAFGDPFLPPGGALAGQLLAALLTLANSLRA